MGPKEIYLIVYNVCLCVSWSFIYYTALVTVAEGMFEVGLAAALSKVYAAKGLATLLTYAQTAALLEIFHAGLGLVRSPVLVTAMQVGSRIVALVAVNGSVEAQSKCLERFSQDAQSSDSPCSHPWYLSSRKLIAQWGAGVMILSWSLVEIFRYMFYAFNLLDGQAAKKSPYPLFFLRYSLFAILYPTGITGELTVFFKAAMDAGFPGDNYGSALVSFAAFFYSKLLPAVYAVGSPFMIMNMAGNRKAAFRKRFEKPPPPRGISFPVDDPIKGSRSSTPVNKEILAAAVGAVNPGKADLIRTARGYRFTYVKHLVGLVEEQCKSPEDCLKIAQAGLDKAYELFEFVAPDGAAVSLKEAMAAKNNESFHTGYIKGEGVKEATGLEIPYKGKTLKGEELKEQVRKWVEYGTIEPSAGEAIIGCVDNPKWCELSDKYFVLLGAGSAMGPLHVLLALGANVIAVDLDRPFIWKRLIELTRKSSGSITFPLKNTQESLKTDDDLYASAGCNLFTHTPMIRDWLMDLYKGKAFTVGSYAYLNGALHVQVSLAMDAITKDLSEKRPNTSLAYLCTPTDLHLVPEEAFRAAEANYKEYSSRPLCAYHVPVMSLRLVDAARC